MVMIGKMVTGLNYKSAQKSGKLFLACTYFGLIYVASGAETLIYPTPFSIVRSPELKYLTLHIHELLLLSLIFLYLIVIKPLQSALNRLLRSNSDIEPFFSPQTEYEPLQASQIFKRYMAAIADELKGSPLFAAILNGSTIRLLVEDEDEFAMLAEGLFIELDVEDTGKIRKSEIRNALVQMEVDMDYFPFSEYPQLNDLLSKHEVDGEGELNQAQFAQLLKFVLQDLEMELSKKNFVFFLKIQIINGSKIRQLLANEKELNSFIEKALQEKLNAKDGLESKKIIRRFLEKNSKELDMMVAMILILIFIMKMLLLM